MKPRGPRWVLEADTHPCACGTRAAYVKNCRSGERLVKAHATPAGKTCPEFEWEGGVERTPKAAEAQVSSVEAVDGGGEDRAERCPRKGEPVSVLWLAPGSTTACSWQSATVSRAMPSRGLFIAQWPAVGGADGDVIRHTFSLYGRDWRVS